jgi:hypothetical protein
MRLFLVLAVSLSGSTAWANLQIGRYSGVTPDGAACGFDVLAVEFEGGLRHPLNERVRVVVEGGNWVLRHAPSIKSAELKVEFDHDHLTAAMGERGAAQAVELTMDHSEGKDGPSKIIWLRHDVRNPSASFMWECGGLKFGTTN